MATWFPTARPRIVWTPRSVMSPAGHRQKRNRGTIRARPHRSNSHRPGGPLLVSFLGWVRLSYEGGPHGLAHAEQANRELLDFLRQATKKVVAA